jgi:cytochrome P450
MDIDPFAFVPFSLGERSCLGRRFGQMTVMTTLALLLQRYEIGVVGRREERTEEWEERKARMLKTENTLTLGPKDKKVQLVFTRR